MLQSTTRLVSLGVVLLLPGLGQAADGAKLGPPAPDAEPAGTLSQDPATAGTTELEGQGKFGTATQDDAKASDVTEFELSAGGLLSTGNARAASLTAASKFRLRRAKNQFSAAFAGNYGRAALDATTDSEATVGNVQGRVRYDYFVHQRVSLFAMLTARHDPFQGLEARINVDPGVAVYVLNDPKNRLWAEVGYDYQFDRRTEEATFAKDDDGAIVLDDMGMPVVAADRERDNHAVRLFGGYENNINDGVKFATGVEYLQSFLAGERWRINWVSGLTAQLVRRFAFGLTLTVRVDNDPAPGIRKVDTITAGQLIYSFSAGQRKGKKK